MRTQRLALIEAGQLAAAWPVSTGAKGVGCEAGSHKTPTGRHRIKLKIGAGQPPGAVFRGRRPTGEVFSQALGDAQPGRDWMLSRILWLDGLEPGHNLGPGVDTLRRFVYIHGTPDAGMADPPSSQGCIRMRNAHVIALFERVPAGTLVLIEASDGAATMPGDP